MQPNWQPIETAPRNRLIVFAVPVHHARKGDGATGDFIRWDTWTDDAADDWSDEREIGWRMSDATMWAECPPAPTS